MIKRQKCSEIQLTLHLLLIFLIGIFVGVSIVQKQDVLVSEIKSSIDKSDSVFSTLNDSYHKNYSQLSE